MTKNSKKKSTSKANDVANTKQSTSDSNYTEKEVQEMVDEIVATPTPKRVWEVDFLRGFMILFVVWDHLMWDIKSQGPYQTEFFTWLFELARTYQTGTLRKATHDVFVTLFVFTSGVSCSFSHSNWKRGVKMAAFALLFTAVTYAVTAIVGMNVTIYFNVIHVIALSVLLWSFIDWCRSKCKKSWQKNIFGAVMTVVTVAVLVIGACANVSPWTNDSPWLYFIVQHGGSTGYSKFKGGDYLPFFPDFGWFLIGAFLGSFLYKEKKSLFPSVNTKWVSPITFCGRYSIWIYFGSQVVMYGVIYLLSSVLHCI